MREMMSRFRDLVRDRGQHKQEQQNRDRAEKREESWEMSSDDALRAPIVSGYK